MEETTAELQANPAVRERLLSEGLRLFTVKGYAGTTVREIVEAAGVTKPVLYYYFNSKEGLYLELMQQSYAIFGQRMRELVDMSGPARERMEHLCLGIFDGFVEFLDVARVIYAIYFGPAQGAPQFDHDQAFDWILSAIRTVVTDGMASKEFRAGDPADMTWVIVGCLNICMEEQLCRETPRIDRDTAKRMLTLVLDGLTPGVER